MNEPIDDRDGLDDAILDNMAWHALTGPQADLSEPGLPESVRRFQRRIAPFSAVDRLDDSGWAALGDLVGPGGVAILFRAEVPSPPSGWTREFHGSTVQYVAGPLDGPDAAVAEEIVELGADDGAEMVELTARTEPGPFSAETWRAGRYFGIRRAGRLVAMAGERLRTDGWGEVSAVCVDPSVRGQGLGAAMTLRAAQAITERGDRAMLHVAEDNHPAHQLYLQLGFEVRRTVAAAAYRLTGA